MKKQTVSRQQNPLTKAITNRNKKSCPVCHLPKGRRLVVCRACFDKLPESLQEILKKSRTKQHYKSVNTTEGSETQQTLRLHYSVTNSVLKSRHLQGV